MPIYDYEIIETGERFERLEFPFGEIPPIGKVVEINGIACRRVISLPAKKATMGDNRYPYVEENIGPHPVEVESPDHRRRLMKQNGLRDGAKKIGDSGQWI